MLVKEVMTRQVVSVRPHDSLKTATQSLERHGITAMPAVDGHGGLVGVISEADVIQDAVLPAVEDKLGLDHPSGHRRWRSLRARARNSSNA
jgi:CBS-domain-containing membrane protein